LGGNGGGGEGLNRLSEIKHEPRGGRDQYNIEL